MYGRGKKSIFWGIMCLLGAAALLASRFGWLKGIGFWSILWNMILLGFLLTGIIKRKSARVLFATAFLIIANDELLHLEAITPWPVLGAALLGSIGLGMLFPRWHIHGTVSEEGTWFSSAWRNGSRYACKCHFGDAVRYISGEVSQVNAECNFGFVQLYFTDAKPMDGRIDVYVETAFGCMVLYVPSDWKTALQIENSFGDARVSGKCRQDGEVVMCIRGEVSFGSLLVRYV